MSPFVFYHVKIYCVEASRGIHVGLINWIKNSIMHFFSFEIFLIDSWVKQSHFNFFFYFGWTLAESKSHFETWENWNILYRFLIKRILHVHSKIVFWLSWFVLFIKFGRDSHFCTEVVSVSSHFMLSGSNLVYFKNLPRSIFEIVWKFLCCGFNSSWPKWFKRYSTQLHP